MELSRTQCHNIKGYAILLIVIHNFVDHLLGIHCNEMAYLQANTDAFLANVVSPAVVWQLFAFVGWIGVALFLFVSGYGLTRKYGDKPVASGVFIKSHVIKLWKLLVPVYLLFFVIYHYVFAQDHNWQSVIAQLTFTINFLDYGKNSFLSEPGVYWFFGAILQCYLLFLAIRRLNNRWLWLLVVLSLIFNLGVIYMADPDTMWWIRQNAFGWIAPFVMGMLAARTPLKVSRRKYALLCLLSLLALAACLVIKPLAPLTEVFTIIFFVSLTGLFTWPVMTFIGVISASLFVIHPLIRMIFYNTLSGSSLSTTTMVAVYLLVTFAVSYLHHLAMKKFES